MHGFDEGLVQKLNYGAVHTYLAHAASSHSMNKTAACRVIDEFIVRHAKTTAPNKNVELNGRDGLKKFHNGVTNWICKVRRINGGWHISIARQLHVFFNTTTLLPQQTRDAIGEAYALLFKVHSGLRNPVERGHLPVYQGCVNDLLHAMKQICLPHSPSKCKSIKYHWPRHWGDTRRELGCSAAEKSLERKLGESQKRNFKFTNGKQNVEVCAPCTLYGYFETRHAQIKLAVLQIIAKMSV